MSETERLARLALDLVNVPSVSRREQAITELIGALVARLPGIEVWHRQPDAIVFGRPGPSAVVLAGHSDTVPEQGNLPGRLEDGFVCGLGSADMKGSLAVMLTLAEEIASGGEWHLNPAFVVFGREELGSSESVLAGLFEACPRILEAELAVMMEPTANRLQAGCLGNINAQLVFPGRAAHSARPWLGVNAIHRAVLALQRVAECQPLSFEVGGLTFREVLSVTEIAGGVANNVVPERCACGLNFRYAGHRSPEAAEARLRELAGPDGELTVIGNAPSAPVNLDNRLLQSLRRAGDGSVGPKQAWTPVAEFAQRGVDAVNLGPGDPELAHRRDERVSVEAMAATLAILRRWLHLEEPSPR